MITLTESGLTSAQYSALKASKTNHAFKVIASRYNLDFGTSPVYNSINAGGGTADFDAIVLDNYIFRISGSVMERCSITTGIWSLQTAFVAATGANPNCPYALAANAGTLYVFASTSTGIQQCTTTDYGATYSAWSTIYSFATATNFYTPNRCGSGGVALASSTDGTNPIALVQASNAFDGKLGNGWYAAAAVVAATLRYDFNATATPAPTITHYALYSCNFKSWTFQGSPDGTTWTTIQTVTNDTGTQTGWREYTPTNSTAYRYYRLNVTAVNGAASCYCREWIMQESTTEQSIMWVSAPAYNRVHFLFCDPAYRLYNLRVINYSGSWTLTSSDIWLTKKPNSMDADTNGTVDWIVLDTEVPGRVVDVADKTVGVKKQIYSMGGLISFEYKNNDWSDHTEIDVIDTLSAFKYRKSVKCTVIAGKMYVTCYSSSGTEAFPFTGDRIYTTKDGRNYSNGKLIAPASLTDTGGFILLAKDDYVYAVERKKVYRSYSTLYTNTIAADIQADITPYILSYTTTQDGMYQYNMTLDNSDGWLDNHAFIRGDNVVIFQHYDGGVYAGANYTYLKATTRMDTFETSTKSDEYVVPVSGRDFLSYTSDYTVSEGSIVKESTLYGLDTFADKTGTQYGGLSHFATIDGEIESSSTLNAVVMNSTDNIDRTATGFSTFSDDLWNGVIDTNFVFSGYTTPTVAMAGIVFKAKDNSLKMSLSYFRQIDTLSLFISASQVASWTAASMGWTATSLTNYRYIRIWMLYGKLRCYSSTDGITWTLKITAFIDMRYAPAVGAPYVADVGDFTIVERGFAGVVANIPHTGA